MGNGLAGSAFFSCFLKPPMCGYFYARRRCSHGKTEKLQADQIHGKDLSL
jgi:hypothetical protein